MARRKLAATLASSGWLDCCRITADSTDTIFEVYKTPQAWATSIGSHAKSLAALGKPTLPETTAIGVIRRSKRVESSLVRSLCSVNARRGEPATLPLLGEEGSQINQHTFSQPEITHQTLFLPQRLHDRSNNDRTGGDDFFAVLFQARQTDALDFFPTE